MEDRQYRLGVAAGSMGKPAAPNGVPAMSEPRTSRFPGMKRRDFLKGAALGGPVVLGRCRTGAAPAEYSLLVAAGTIVDGSGGAGYRSDVGIRDGRISAVGDLRDASAVRRIDAGGLTVAPGFIDIHNHSDDTLLLEPLCESMVRQGVTTMVLGEGNSAGPIRPGEKEWDSLGGYFDHVQSPGCGG
jgi:hypothetical protein